MFFFLSYLEPVLKPLLFYELYTLIKPGANFSAFRTFVRFVPV